MDIPAINHYFKLNPMQVSPKQLLLDPSNPRITVDMKKRNDFSNSELASEELQEEILRKINKDEHHVSELIKSIGQSGFIDGLANIIVKKISTSNKYLVIEGNRRTTAIKHLLSKKEKLTPKAIETLKEIRVEELKYQKNGEYTEDDIIDIILGTIHIKGPLAWGAMEKAHYVYSNYMRQYTKHFQGNRFKYNLDCLKRVCALFPYKQGDVKKSLMVYKIYLQLIKNRFAVDTDRFTLIELAVNDLRLREEYFEFVDIDYRFSERGLDRLYDLCIKDDRVISNPKEFRMFRKIFLHGKEFLKDIENGTSSIKEVYDDIGEELQQGKEKDKLKVILRKLKMLNLSLVEDEECVKIIKKIIYIVNDKIAPLLGENNGSSDEGNSPNMTLEDHDSSNLVAGDNVNHKVLGRGRITRISPNTVIVFFKNGGTKKLDRKRANLKKI